MIDQGTVKYSDGTLLQICEYAATCSDNTVEICEIPPNTTRHKLLMFLENRKRSGGGNIDEIQYYEGKRTALVTFKDQKGINLHHTLNLFVCDYTTVKGASCYAVII